MATQDELREEVIDKIKRSFSKNHRLKKISRWSTGDYIQAEIEKYFQDGTWEKFVGDARVVYIMTDVDYVQVLKPEAYIYYFPALLITELSNPSHLNGVPFILRIYPGIFEKFDTQHLEALLAFVEYFVEFYGQENWLSGEMEDLQLRIMMRLDEVKDS